MSEVIVRTLTIITTLNHMEYVVDTVELHGEFDPMPYGRPPHFVRPYLHEYDTVAVIVPPKGLGITERHTYKK